MPTGQPVINMTAENDQT